MRQLAIGPLLHLLPPGPSQVLTSPIHAPSLVPDVIPPAWQVRRALRAPHTSACCVEGSAALEPPEAPGAPSLGPGLGARVAVPAVQYSRAGE
jgi:hypothetical protein